MGIALFGVVPNALRRSRSAEEIGIASVYQLIARPVRIATLPTGHGVGYGPHFVAERPSRIITLPIGYADGISYHEKGKAEVLVRGVRLPVVGSIAMDSITIDATDHPATDLSTLDDVVFIGRSGATRFSPWMWRGAARQSPMKSRQVSRVGWSASTRVADAPLHSAR